MDSFDRCVKDSPENAATFQNIKKKLGRENGSWLTDVRNLVGFEIESAIDDEDLERPALTTLLKGMLAGAPYEHLKDEQGLFNQTLKALKDPYHEQLKKYLTKGGSIPTRAQVRQVIEATILKIAREEGINLHERRDNNAAQPSVSNRLSVSNAEAKDKAKLLDDLLNESKSFSSVELAAIIANYGDNDLIVEVANQRLQTPRRQLHSATKQVDDRIARMLDQPERVTLRELSLWKDDENLTIRDIANALYPQKKRQEEARLAQEEHAARVQRAAAARDQRAERERREAAEQQNNNNNNNMLPQYNRHQENERKRLKPNPEVTIEEILNIWQPPKPRQGRNNDDGCTIS